MATTVVRLCGVIAVAKPLTPDAAGKRFTTALGAITIERAYYHCAACNAGFCPRDRALGMEGNSLSVPGHHQNGGAARLPSASA